MKIVPMGKTAKTAKPSQKLGIDWPGVRLAWGLAALAGGMGALVIYATPTAPDGAAPETMSRAMDVTYQLARRLPEDVKSRIAAGLGGLFVLGGLWFASLGLMLFLPSKWIPKR